MNVKIRLETQGENLEEKTLNSASSRRRFLLSSYFVIALLIFALALFTRLYDLSTFPFFKSGWPTCGGIPDCKGPFPAVPGIYSDEVTDLLLSHSIRGIVSNFGGGPVASLLIFFSTHAFGITMFAVRLPFALISSMTAVAVYFTTRAITRGGKIPAVLSSIYFIVMVPALIYGRMAFGENLTALLFVINFYSTLKISQQFSSPMSGTDRKRRWFLVAALSAAFGIIIKFNGVIIAVYFVVFLIKERLLRKGAPYVGLALVLGILLPLAVLQIVTSQALGLVMRGLYPFVIEMGNQLGLFHYYFLVTLPSGATVNWTLYDAAPEFWYIFLYIAIAALMIYSYKQYSNLLLALGVFVAFFGAFPGAFESYWLVLIQPLLAIGFGPGLKRLLSVPNVATLGLYAFPFVPVVASVGEYLITPSQVANPPIVNFHLFLWNLGISIPLAFLLFFTVRKHAESPRWRMWINAALLFLFFVFLIIASFLLPDLYPYYF